MNEYCTRKLATPGVIADPVTLPIVEAAARVASDRLVGVVVFGSWARDEVGPDSDIDVLIVLDAEAPVTRSLYRAWDAVPVGWVDREVEPHFVTRPPAGRRVLGVWAEAAIDGVVLFERNLEVSRRLAGVRREIADGRIRRRTVHGQPYWVEAA